MNQHPGKAQDDDLSRLQDVIQMSDKTLLVMDGHGQVGHMHHMGHTWTGGAPHGSQVVTWVTGLEWCQPEGHDGAVMASGRCRDSESCASHAIIVCVVFYIREGSSPGVTHKPFLGNN